MVGNDHSGWSNPRTKNEVINKRTRRNNLCVGYNNKEFDKKIDK